MLIKCVAALQIGLHQRADGSIDTGAFKIVYVAPMKALVAEMVGNFGKRLEKFGIQARARRQPPHADVTLGQNAGLGATTVATVVLQAQCTRNAGVHNI